MASRDMSEGTQATLAGDDKGVLSKETSAGLRSPVIVHEHRISLGDPSLLGLLGFLIPFTTTIFEFLRFQGANAQSLIATSGVDYFYGGIAMNVAGLIEFFRGNSFLAAGYLVYGCFWCELGWANDPLQNLAGAYAANGVPGEVIETYTSGGALFFLSMTLASFVLFLGTLRTNVGLCLAVFCLVPLFALLTAGDLHIGYDPTPTGLDHATYLFKVAGGFGFVTALCGWYSAIVLVCQSTGIPCPLPTGDINAFLARMNRSRARKAKKGDADVANAV